VVQLADIAETITQQIDGSPDTAIYLVVEDGEAIVDRGPLLTGTWDQLRNAGLELFLVGAPQNESSNNEQ
jgi:hypothetical protein